MKIQLTPDDLLPACAHYSLGETTLSCFAVPERLLLLAGEIEYIYSPEVVAVFKDRDGTYN